MSQQFDYKEIIKSQFPLAYKDNAIETSTLGNTLNTVQEDVNLLEKEVNPLICKSIGLETWEAFFKIPENPNASIDLRRAKVISELIQLINSDKLIEKEDVERIMALFADTCMVKEHFAERRYDVVLGVSGENQQSISLPQAYETMKTINPSWLTFNMGIDFVLKDSNIYTGACITSGDELVVYPWSTSEIECSASIELGTSLQTIDTISVYPKE